MRTLATAGNLALLVVFVRLSLKLVGHARVETVWWVAGAAVWCEPVWTTLRYGQINLLLAVLVLWDLTRRPADGHDRWSGLGLGLATAVKLTPGLFPVFLLATGLVDRLRGGRGEPWLRHARGAAVAFAGATLLAAAVLPYDSWRFWTRMVFHASRVGLAEDTGNQALRGILARLLHTGPGGRLGGRRRRTGRPRPDGGGAGGVAGAAGLGGVRLRGHRAVGQPGVVDPPLGVVRAAGAAAVDARAPGGGPGHRAGLLVVPAVVGAARVRTAGTPPGERALAAVGYGAAGALFLALTRTASPGPGRGPGQAVTNW
ncbi:glycosyltransferase family 87 protein [Streptomyces nogalater]